MRRDQLEALIALERQSREERLAEFSSLSDRAESMAERMKALTEEASKSRQSRHRERAEASSDDILSIGELQFITDAHSQAYEIEKKLESDAEQLGTEHRDLTESLERARDELGESIGRLKALEARLETLSDSERLERERQDEEQ